MAREEPAPCNRAADRVLLWESSGPVRGCRLPSPWSEDPERLMLRSSSVSGLEVTAAISAAWRGAVLEPRALGHGSSKRRGGAPDCNALAAEAGGSALAGGVLERGARAPASLPGLRWSPCASACGAGRANPAWRTTSLHPCPPGIALPNAPGAAPSAATSCFGGAARPMPRLAQLGWGDEALLPCKHGAGAWDALPMPARPARVPVDPNMHGAARTDDAATCLGKLATGDILGCIGAGPGSSTRLLCVRPTNTEGWQTGWPLASRSDATAMRLETGR
mmetsp:Transcript_113549/g.366869  ORF Transcript_113549/g.366869 Transcript_113549/m.366869 type:complete len:278 (+) Transcript_113549:311-1144(+)